MTSQVLIKEKVLERVAEAAIVRNSLIQVEICVYDFLYYRLVFERAACDNSTRPMPSLEP